MFPYNCLKCFFIEILRQLYGFWGVTFEELASNWVVPLQEWLHLLCHPSESTQQHIINVWSGRGSQLRFGNLGNIREVFCFCMKMQLHIQWIWQIISSSNSIYDHPYSPDFIYLGPRAPAEISTGGGGGHNTYMSLIYTLLYKHWLN